MMARLSCLFAQAAFLYVLLFLSLPSATGAPQELYQHGDPTAFEQLMLESVNRARAYPAAEAARLRIDLNKGLASGQISPEAKQPLAFHPILLEAARRHADWMLQRGIFSHTGANASTPTDRAAALGFAFGVSENLARQSTSAAPNLRVMTQNNHAALVRSASHRSNLMNPELAVVGIGIRRGFWKRLNSQMVVQKFSAGGETLDSGPFMVGVAYADLNRNGVYDPGEGRSGIEVRPDSGTYYAVTSSSGGFAIPIEATQTTSEEVALSFPLQGKTFDDAQIHDIDFRAARFAAAPEVQVQLRWSGGSLPAPLETTARMKKAVRINYELKGTDNFFISRTMVTAPSVRANLRLTADGQLAPRLPQTVSFIPPRPVTYAPGRVVPLKGSASSRLPVTFASTNDSAEVSGSVVFIRGAGQFDIIASQTGDDVYQPAQQKRVLKVAKAKQVITFLLPRKVSLAAGTLALEAPNKSGLPVTFTSNLPDMVSINGNTATLYASGSVEITATQDGDNNYLPAKPVKRLLTVTP